MRHNALYIRERVMNELLLYAPTKIPRDKLLPMIKNRLKSLINYYMSNIADSMNTKNIISK